MYKYICKTCGKAFEAPQKNRQYCSMDCRQLPGAPKSFSEEEELEICRLYATPNKQGLYVGSGQIAKKFNVNPKTIHNILNRRGVEKRSKTFYVENQPHHNLTRVPPQGEQPPLCACGCGLPVEWIQKKNRWARFAKGHYKGPVGKISKRWNGGPKKFICKQCGKEFEDWGERSYCSPECQGIAKRSPHYDGDARWHKWHGIRTQIRKRDNWTCQDCGYYGKGIKRAIHVHHLDENPTNNDPANLICLCARCHLKRHGCELPDDWEYDGVSL